MVDEWSVKCVEYEQTGEAELNEMYCSLTLIEKTNEQKYLGFFLSNTGDNMANIKDLRKTSFLVIRTTINKLERDGNEVNLTNRGKLHEINFQNNQRVPHNRIILVIRADYSSL